MDKKDSPDLDHVEALKPATVPVQSQGDVLLVTSEDVRRVPVPTDNPNDPLNSKPFKKLMIVANCCWFGKSPPNLFPHHFWLPSALADIRKRSFPF